MQRDSNQGLGLPEAANPEADDNEYDAYRKRMMLAYRLRPNPLVSFLSRGITWCFMLLSILLAEQPTTGVLLSEWKELSY